MNEGKGNIEPEARKHGGGTKLINNTNDRYLDRLTRTSPKRLHVL